MEGKIFISSSYELKRVESIIFDEMYKGTHIHVLTEDHVCKDENNYFNMLTTNRHPSIKSIFVQRDLMWEMKILDEVLKKNKLEGLSFFCPACPIGTAQQF